MYTCEQPNYKGLLHDADMHCRKSCALFHSHDVNKPILAPLFQSFVRSFVHSLSSMSLQSMLHWLLIISLAYSHYVSVCTFNCCVHVQLLCAQLHPAWNSNFNHVKSLIFRLYANANVMTIFLSSLRVFFFFWKVENEFESRTRSCVQNVCGNWLLLGRFFVVRMHGDYFGQFLKM